MLIPSRNAGRNLIRGLIVAMTAIALALTTAAAPASALTWLTKLCVGYAGCGNAGRGNGGYANANGTSYWNMYAGHNCTNYVAYRQIQNGAPSSLGYNLGNATTWGTVASAHGVTVDNNPAIGAVAWFKHTTSDTDAGHVAYVEAIEGDRIIVSEDNWGGDFDWRPYKISDVTGFIHFKDVNLGNPFGALDSVTSPAPGVIRVGGWAADPDSKSGPLAVHVYANDQAIAITANQPRPDVAAAFPGYGGDLGYSADLQFRVSGSVTVCSYAINVGAGNTNTQLGCKAVAVVNPLSFGSLDSVVDAGGQRVTVSGWAADANLPDGPMSVHIYANGAFAGAVTANAYRPDVPKVIGAGYGDRLGFVAALPLPTSGQMHVCAYGINAGPGWGNTELGCRDVAVAHSIVGPSPTLKGQPRVGAVLTAQPGTWYPAPVGLSYQWLRNGTVISGATKAIYALAAADLGASISVRVTGSKSGYISVTKTSAATVKVTAGILTAATPKVSGQANVGKTLTGTTMSWAPAPVTLAYQWLRNGAAISAATKTSYTLTAADLGAAISVQVTGSKTGYASVSKVSAPTAKVIAAPNPATITGATPKISGKAKVGKKLTCKPGAWQPAGVSLTYQWFRNGKAITGATKVTYKLTKASKGKRITVTVTGHKSGYTAISKTSAKTAKVKK